MLKLNFLPTQEDFFEAAQKELDAEAFKALEEMVEVFFETEQEDDDILQYSVPEKLSDNIVASLMSLTAECVEQDLEDKVFIHVFDYIQTSSEEEAGDLTQFAFASFFSEMFLFTWMDLTGSDCDFDCACCAHHDDCMDH